MYSLPSLYKKIGNYNPSDGIPVAETSIIVDQVGAINSGKPFTITFCCGNEMGWPMVTGNIPNLVIRDFLTSAVLKQVPWPAGGYRGFAINQTIGGLTHIFATQDPDGVANANAFVHATMDASFNIVATQTIWGPYAGIHALMGGASPTPAGGWTISYQNQFGLGYIDWPDAQFTPGPQSPTNPNGWVNVPTEAPKPPITFIGVDGQYQASDGYWYRWMQNQNSTYYWVTLGRSTDRVHWAYSSKTFLYPDMPQVEGVDASDVRMVEYQGETLIIHLDGDQVSWSNIRIAKYQGTIAQLRAEFF